MATQQERLAAKNAAPKAAKKPRAPKKVLTAAELKEKLAKAKAAVQALEQRAYGSQLTEVIKGMRFEEAFKKIEAEVKGASKLAILKAIGDAAGIKRLNITQSDPVPRKPKAK